MPPKTPRIMIDAPGTPAPWAPSAATIDTLEATAEREGVGFVVRQAWEAGRLDAFARGYAAGLAAAHHEEW